MLKRGYTVGLLILLAATLAACGSSGSGQGSKHYRFVYIAGIASDPYYIALNKGAQAEAQKEGITVDFEGSTTAFSPATQIPILNAAIASKPDLIMIAPTDTVALQAPLQQAVNAGIPVILVDTTLQNPSLAVTSIAFDNVAGGAQAADALAQAIGGKGKVAIVHTTPGTSTGDDRVKGFDQEMASKYPNIKNLGPTYTGDDPTRAAAVLKALLTANPDLSGVFTINGVVGDGVTAAAREAGVEGKLKLVEYGSSSSQLAGLKNGTVTACIGPSPYTIGQDAVQYGVQYLNGDHNIQKQYNTPQMIITAQNVNDPASQPFEY
ncbi:MAG TPA: ABC transporter substrate-binding protein [Ktedonobacterales bacterium]|nr:ABC transporter substrate-binding protein [Ktedonobacterales bacterium]